MWKQLLVLFSSFLLFSGCNLFGIFGDNAQAPSDNSQENIQETSENTKASMDTEIVDEENSENESDNEMNETMNEESEAVEDTEMEEGETNDDESSEESEDMNEGVTYKEFNKAEFEANLGKKPMIVFFHAPWCPTCKALDALLNKDLGLLEGDITVYKADFDTETELKSEHGVTIQHSLLVFNASGEMVKKEQGTRTIKQMQALISLTLN